MFIDRIEILIEKSSKKDPPITYGRLQLMYGPASRVNQSGSFFHVSTRAAYFGLSGLAMDKSWPGLVQY